VSPEAELYIYQILHCCSPRLFGGAAAGDFYGRLRKQPSVTPYNNIFDINIDRITDLLLTPACVAFALARMGIWDEMGNGFAA